MTCGIYQIVSISNSKLYIGSAENIENCRWYDHEWMLKRGKHHCIHLQRAYNKYGAAAFKFQIKECEAPNLEMAESIEHIKKGPKGQDYIT